MIRRIHGPVSAGSIRNSARQIATPDHNKRWHAGDRDLISTPYRTISLLGYQPKLRKQIYHFLIVTDLTVDNKQEINVLLYALVVYLHLVKARSWEHIEQYKHTWPSTTVAARCYLSYLQVISRGPGDCCAHLCHVILIRTITYHVASLTHSVG